MIKINKIILLLLLISSLISSLISCKINKNNYVKYYQNVNEAEYFFYSKNYQNAVIQYERAFNLVPNIYEQDRYKYIISLNNSGRKEEAIRLLKKYPNLFQLCDSNYFQNISKEERLKIEQNAILIDSLNYDSLSKTIIFKQMIQIYESDQKYRKILANASRNHENIDYKIYMDSINHNDSINRLEILKILSKEEINAGVNNPFSAFWSVIFLHLPYEFLYENNILFQNAIIKGYLMPNYYYGAVDRYFHDECSSKSLYFQYSREPIELNPNKSFKNLSEKGLSPYYFSNRYYSWGKLPPKNIYYNTYSNEKNKYNCLKYKVNLKIPKKINCK